MSKGSGGDGDQALNQTDLLRGARLLLVEDARQTRRLVASALVDEGCVVTVAGNGQEAEDALAGVAFDAVVLDLGLPDGDGVARCRAWRQAGMRTPILMLTARADVGSRVAGLDAGADDYLYKPFALAELRARLRALLRRAGRDGAEAGPAPVYRQGDLLVDFGRRQAFRAGVEIPLTRRELEVLDRLARAEGHAVSREDLLDEIWGEVTTNAAQSLEVIVARLRRKLDPTGGERLIRTIRGHGYALEASERGERS